MSIELPPSLIQSVRAGSCVPFVGSGLSVAAGLPGWRTLLERLIEYGEREGLIKQGADLRAELDKEHFLEVSEFVRHRLGPHRYGTIIRGSFDVPIEPTKAHEALVATPYRGIITTNYDKLLETAYTLKHRRVPRRVTWSQSASLGSVLFDHDFFVFKLHGDVDDIESVVLTRRDYDNIMFKNPHVRTFLQAIFMTSTLFFIGYSLHDPDFEIAMAEIPLLFGGTTPTSFALLPKTTEVFQEHYKNRMNVQVIPYDPADRHAAVGEVLEAIRQATEAAEQAAPA